MWGYLIPLDARFGDTLVLKKRGACPAPVAPLEISTNGKSKGSRDERGTRNHKKDEENYEKTKLSVGFPAGGYLIGRHPECGMCHFLYAVFGWKADILQTQFWIFQQCRIGIA